MEFEFDPAKSDANKAKHGIDFVAAQEVARRKWFDHRRALAR
ncbi:BrnT family toxin [Rhizobium sp. CECT 9324]|nr:BrnT family toxin [Rhizobium sp. CECT 9324]